MSGHLVIAGSGIALEEAAGVASAAGYEPQIVDLGRALPALPEGAEFVPASLDGLERRRIWLRLRELGLRPATLVHPDATLGSEVRLQPGAVVGARARLTTNIEAGRCLWVGAGATLSHDGRYGDFVAIGAGANLTGNVHVGDFADIGAAAVVIPGCRVASSAWVHPASVVIDDLPPGSRVAGAPARPGGLPAGPYRGKRVVDLAVVAVLALPALVLALACALAVRLTSRGPVLFRQTRVGRWERPFEMLKFRTMVHAPDNPLIPDDDRITAAGRWLRRLSLDELPQLWNVATGEMSVVGPRPALPYQLELFDRRQRARHVVRPGLTGLAQVRGRNRIGWAARIEHDLEYLQSQSVWLDLRLLAGSVPALLSGAGASGHPPDDDLIAEGGHGPTA